MEKDNKFTVYYDDQPHEAVSKIESILKQYGISILDITEEDSEFLEYEIFKNETYEDVKGYLVETGHDSSYATSIFVKTYDEAVDTVHQFFLSYDFIIKDGKPFDGGNDDGKSEGWDVFGEGPESEHSDWEIIEHKGELKVIKFIHCDGDGPVANIRENG